MLGALIGLLFTAAGGICSWRYMYNPCEVDDVKEASDFLVSQLKSYDGQYQFTTTVYPNGLAAPVSVLQRIYVDTQTVDVPVCMRTAKKELTDYMGTIITAFQAFGAGEDNAKIRELLGQSDRHYLNFKKELQAVNECAPFCFR